jgi:hypothetical protein
MGQGDLIRVIKVPDSVKDSEEFKTRTILELCLGRVFTVMGFHRGFIQIDVGEVIGKASYLESIWIEPDCVEAVKQ